MSFDYVRRLVSGNKARFRDQENAVDLDLVYVTDRIIIMGYPAVGVSALYRNRRRDVLKFINSRHGDKWWIWNLCPLYENAYSPESMHNRVSRYPFPDHHPPPLPLLPLAVREMTAWLEGDSERIAIIHCKAGKGRSGTLLCSYMLSLDELPSPPQLDRSYTQKEVDRRRKEREIISSHSSPEPDARWVMVGAGQEFSKVQVPSDTPGQHTPQSAETLRVKSVARSTTSSTTTISQPSGPPSIELNVVSGPPFEPIAIGDEGAPGDVGQRDRLDGRVDDVFRLHSSRRMKPTSSGRGVSIPSQRRWCRYIHLLFNEQAPPAYLNPGQSRVLLKSVTMVLHHPTGLLKPVTSLALAPGGKAWASVARYDDDYVAELRRRGGAGEGVDAEITWGGVGGEGRFDTEKMFRSCGKMIEADQDRGHAGNTHNVYHLKPQLPNGTEALILQRDREFRLKLHLGSLPLGWLWMIPAFHFDASASRSGHSRRITFPRSQIDFPLGPGQMIHEIILELEDVVGEDRRPPARLMTAEEEDNLGFKDDRGEKVKEEGE